MLRKIHKVLSFKISQFKAANEAVRAMNDEKSTQKIPQAAKEKLDQLYRQATQGYKMETPYNVDEDDVDKVEFWSKHMGLSKEKAEADYVNYVDDILYYEDRDKTQNYKPQEQD